MPSCNILHAAFHKLQFEIRPFELSRSASWGIGKLLGTLIYIPYVDVGDIPKGSMGHVFS
jgi:hypothetical protein